MENLKLYLFKKGLTYYVQYTDAMGKNRQLSTRSKTKPQALQFLSDFKENLIKRKQPDIMLSTFLREYLDYIIPILAISTVRSYKLAMETFIGIIGDRKLKFIIPKTIDQYLSKRRHQISDVSVNIEFRSIKAAFNVARKWGYFQSSPCEDIHQVKCVEKKPIFLSHIDIDKLLHTIERVWLRQIVMFGLMTGLRLNEILNLQWSSVNFKLQTFLVTSDDKFQTKSRKYRIVPMNTIAFEILNKRIEVADGDYVFHSKGFRLNGTYVSKAFKKDARIAGLSEEIKFHCLRKSFASHLVISGVDIYAVSKLLGHSDVSITTKHYAHLRPEQLHKEVNLLSLPNSESYL